MKLYYKEHQQPEPLPFTILLVDTEGRKYTRTDPDTFTDEEIALAGYTLAPPKPSLIPATSSVDWDHKNKSWVIRSHVKSKVPVTADELWAEIRRQRNHLLKEADKKVLYNYEHGITDPALAEYKQKLRDITTSVKDPRFVVWPEMPERIEE